MSPGVLKIHHHPSPNFNDRPGGTVIDTVIIHATVVNSLEDTIEIFGDPESQVSAHYTIDRDGKIAAHVPENFRAWHAGQSFMPDGRTGVNDFSIGIELVNLNDGYDPYPDSQIYALNTLLSEIVNRYPIKFILPHHQVAHPPGRKSDPKGLNFSRIKGSKI